MPLIAPTLLSPTELLMKIPIMMKQVAMNTRNTSWDATNKVHRQIAFVIDARTGNIIEVKIRIIDPIWNALRVPTLLSILGTVKSVRGTSAIAAAAVRIPICNSLNPKPPLCGFVANQTFDISENPMTPKQ
jgi:hypothetical protein